MHRLPNFAAARPHPTFVRAIARTLAGASLALANLLAVAPAHADSRKLLPRNPLPVYTQECAACHMAFAPGFLPAKSWQHMMGSLDKHYGTDASLDAATVQQIATWLAANAGTYKRVAEAPPEDRMTRAAWFERKHRKIDPQVWKHTSIKSAANCLACHTRADKGHYDDDSVAYPQGLPARFRTGWND